MNSNDRTWADLHPASAAKRPSNQCIYIKPLGVIKQQNRLVRAAKALRLFVTTRYSLALSWEQAAR